MNEHYERLVKKLIELYPNAARAVSVRERLSPNLISSSQVRLPGFVFNEAQAACEAFFELRQNKKYQQQVASKLVGPHASGLCENGNFSALMSFDFHVADGQQLKLIEINTNASSSLLIDLIYRERSIANPYGDDFQKEIVATFRREFELCFAGVKRQLQTIAIIDAHPQQQRMYIEFELYKDLFERAGLQCVIGDISEFQIKDGALVGPGDQKIDLVYNRHTDFYLAQPESAVMLEAYRNKLACFSPDPREYALLADKERLLEISVPGALEQFGISAQAKATIDRVLLKSYDANKMPREELWAGRRKFFFKPKRSYGGKAAFRGASISKGAFQKMFESEVVAQEFAPAPELEVALPGGSREIFKYDLRFYAYQNHVQMVAARIYQGQTTNMNSLGGGFAPLIKI